MLSDEELSGIERRRTNIAEGAFDPAGMMLLAEDVPKIIAALREAQSEDKRQAQLQRIIDEERGQSALEAKLKTARDGLDNIYTTTHPAGREGVCVCCKSAHLIAGAALEATK